MVLRKHLLGTAVQLLNGVGVVVHRLLEDHVPLQRQQGTLLVLEGEEDEERIGQCRRRKQKKGNDVKKRQQGLTSEENKILQMKSVSS